MKKFMNEFKEFALKGSVMDMAVGVIIGAAFKSIVDSFVADILNPIIGIAFQTDLSQIIIHLPGDVQLKLGNFLSTVINFILMALILFCVVKSINSIKNLHQKEEEEAPAPQKSEELLALQEIVSLLKEKKD